jgi:hypothetical protein
MFERCEDDMSREVFQLFSTLLFCTGVICFMKTLFRGVKWDVPREAVQLFPKVIERFGIVGNKLSLHTIYRAVTIAKVVAQSYPLIVCGNADNVVIVTKLYDRRGLGIVVSPERCVHCSQRCERKFC